MITLWTGPRFCLRSSVLSIDVSLHVSFSMGRVCAVLVWALFTVSLFFRMNKSMKSHSFYCCKWSATYVTKYVLLTFYDKSEKKKVNRSTSSTESLQRLWDGISNWNAGYERVIFLLLTMHPFDVFFQRRTWTPFQMTMFTSENLRISQWCIIVLYHKMELQSVKIFICFVTFFTWINGTFFFVFLFNVLFQRRISKCSPTVWTLHKFGIMSFFVIP